MSPEPHHQDILPILGVVDGNGWHGDDLQNGKAREVLHSENWTGCSKFLFGSSGKFTNLKLSADRSFCSLVSPVDVLGSIPKYRMDDFTHMPHKYFFST